MMETIDRIWDNGQLIRVIRGAYKNCTGSVEGPDTLEGFYWVWLDTWVRKWRRDTLVEMPGEPVRVMLAGGQLERKDNA